MDDNKEKLTPSPEKEIVDANEQPEIKFETEGSTIFVKHEYNTKKPTKNGWKKRIGLSVLAVFLCVVIAGLSMLVVKLIPNDDGTSSTLSVTSQETITVLSADSVIKETVVKTESGNYLTSTNIDGVGIYNFYETYSILPYTEKVKSDNEADPKECIKWNIQGLKSEHLLSDSLHSHFAKCVDIVATAKMENTYGSVEEYHKAFGLDEPSRVFIMSFNDGTEDLEILVGKQTATRDANYLTVKGDDTVYIVSDTQIANYDYLPKHFANLNMVDAIEETDKNEKYFTNGTLSRFDYIKISGTVVGGRKLEFGLNTDVSADYMPYMMISPYKRPAEESFLESILAFAQNGLTAEDLYSFEATKENKKKCGFDDPGCVLEVKIGSYKFKLIVGGLMGEDSTSLSAMIEGKQQIFGIDAETLDFLSPDINSMFNRDFILENITTIDNLTIQDSTGKYTFDLTHKKRTDAQDMYDTSVKYQGKTADVTSFKSLYKRVLLLSLLSFVTEAPKTEPILTITFDYVGDYSDRVVEFTESPNDSYHCVAWVDGVPLGEVLKSSVTDITNNLKIFVEGGTVPYV